jgi:hypothetical protein
MPTFSELQAKVELRVIDIPNAIELEVADLINQAMRELQRKHNFKVMEAETGGTTDVDADPNNLLVARPSDFKGYRGQPFVRVQYGRNRVLDVLDNRGVAELRYGRDPDESQGCPKAIYEDIPTDILSASSFYFAPFPDGASDWDDGEYRIVIPYWKYLPALVADGDENWFTENADEWLVNRATGEAFMLNEDEQRATIWLQRAQTVLKELLDAEAERRMSGITHLVPHTDVNE